MMVSHPVSELRTENQAAVGVILAAGMGKRMKTSLPKVAHEILGKPMVLWAVEAFCDAGITDVVVVTAPSQQNVRDILERAVLKPGCKVTIAIQPEALGTANAVSAAIPSIKSIISSKNLPLNTDIVVGFGDTPAVSFESFFSYLNFHRKSEKKVTILGFKAPNPTGYGRILTNKFGDFEAIREQKDCSAEELNIDLCNSGFICVKADLAIELLPKIVKNNSAGEYYLTDLPFLAKKDGHKVGIYNKIAAAELEGVNSQEQLATMAKFIQARIIDAAMQNGVQFLNPLSAYVEPHVSFESDVIVEPFVYLAGHSHFKKGIRIASFSKYIDGTMQ